MIAAFRTPASRIVFAIALSALMHVAILWLPYVHLPHDKVQLPPLTARLEPQPKPADQAAARPESASPMTRPGDGVSPASAAEAAGTMMEMKKSAAAPARMFPAHVQLVFAVYRGTGFLRAGEIRHQLDIHRDRYILKALRQAVGLSGMLDGEQIVQTSYGKIGEQGLQPAIFEQEKITRAGRESLKATFDRAAQALRFSQGGETALPADAQDILSFMYQLSQLSIRRDKEYFPLSVSDGTRLDQHQVEIGREENISTPLGDLRALHLRKMHAPNEAYFEIWLGMEYRLLPVKFRQVDESGEVIEEFVISDIRAEDK